MTFSSITTLAQDGPIKIGLLAPMTGVLATSGEDMANGFKLSIGGGFFGSNLCTVSFGGSRRLTEINRVVGVTLPASLRMWTAEATSTPSESCSTR